MLEDGTCLDSMALQTAVKFGISEQILNRAKSLQTEFDRICRIGEPANDFSFPISDTSQDLQVDELSEENNTPDTFNSEIGEDISLLKNGYVELIDSKNSLGTKTKRYDLAKLIPIIRETYQSTQVSDSEEDQRRDVSPLVVEPEWAPPVLLEGKNCVYVLHVFKKVRFFVNF